METSHDVFINILNSFPNYLLVLSKLGMSLKLFSDDIKEVLVSLPEVHMVHLLGLLA